MTKQEIRLQRHRETSRLWRVNNLERAKANWKRFYERNKETLLARGREEYKANPEKDKMNAKRWVQEHPERAKERDRKWREENREWVRERFLLWHEKHPEKSKEYNRKRRSTIKGRIEDVLRKRLQNALKGKIKMAKAIALLGCSIDFFRDHLEAQFKPGMTWKNYGRKGWVIDHKQPCISFDLTDPNQQRKCFRFSNLQPLWDHENAKKHCKPAHEFALTGG